MARHTACLRLLLLLLSIIARTGYTQTSTITSPATTAFNATTNTITTSTAQPQTTSTMLSATTDFSITTISTTPSTTTTDFSITTISTTPSTMAATTSTPWIVTASANSLVRLLDQQYPCQGRVEVLQNDSWQFACFYHPYVSYPICQDLGCGEPMYYNYYYYYDYMESYPTSWSISCSGLETSISQCTISQQSQYCQNYYWSNTRGYLTCSGAGLRLVGGINRCEGRVQVYKSSEWGEFCSAVMNKNIADNVCRLLGCGWSLANGNLVQFGLANGTIFPDYLGSSGRRIFDGLYSGTNNCNSSQTAAVICEAAINPNVSQIITGPSSDNIRLVDRDTACQGRLEILNDSEWGAVCGNNDYLSRVACRELGCGWAVASVITMNTPPGPSLSVQCGAAAMNITQCSMTRMNKYDCLQQGYAYTVCSASGLRLVGGVNRCEGRVEIAQGSEWGVVCDSAINDLGADAICRLLGCGWSIAHGVMQQFGQASTVPVSDNLACSMSSNRISDCLQPGQNNCSRFQAASIICEAAGTANTQLITTAPENGTVKLVDRQMECRGRVEIFYNGTWESLCESTWNLASADVVCRQLGCGNAVNSQANYGLGPSGPMWTSTCHGPESSLLQCTLSPSSVNTCITQSAAGVQCTAAGIRLVGGLNRCEGQLEVLQGGVWSTLCGSSLAVTSTSDEVCRMLGCGWSLQHGNLPLFGNTTAPVLSNNLACPLFSNSIFGCLQPGVNSCDGTQTAALVCESSEPTSQQFVITPSPDGTLQLVDREITCRGKVELINNGTLSTVCWDTWYVWLSEIVCQQLSCGSSTGYAYYPYNAYYFGVGAGSSWTASCAGTEQALSECTLSPPSSYQCLNKGPAGVLCTAAGLRLQGGMNRCEGRVQIYKRGEWGELCGSTIMDRNIADDICRLLGCGWSLVNWNLTGFGQGNGKIFPDNLVSGYNSISDALQYGTNECSYNQTATVICEAAGTADQYLIMTYSPNGRVRLVDRDLRCQGRIEVFHNGTWGPLVSYNWDVCGEVQCGTVLRTEMPRGLLQNQTWAIYCTGTEQSLADCSFSPANKYSNGQSGNMKVICSAAGVRLLEGDNACGGRLEVYHSGRWGTLCDTALGYREADVICHSLKCGQAAFVGYTEEFGPASVSYFPLGVSCSKLSPSLASCSWSSPVTTCNGTRVASVICEVPVEKTMTFTGYDGVILSNNFTVTDTALTYTFVIQAVPPNVIKINFDNISLQASTLCDLERLEVWDGGQSEGNSLAALCGMNAVGGHLKSTKSFVSLVLRARAALGDRGFTISYSSGKVTRPKLTPTCGMTVMNVQSPWVLLMQNTYIGGSCDAAFIGREWILTSATCINTGPSYQWRVYWFPNYNNGWWWNWNGGYSVVNIFVHPRFNASRPDYDLALVQMSQSMQSSQYVYPACLPYISEAIPFPGKYCYLHSAMDKQNAPYSIIDPNECKSVQFNNSGITSRMICTNSEGCVGGSSKILMCQGVDGLWYVAGISNRLWQCGTNEVDLRAFTRVQKFLGFIKATSGLEAYHQV